MNRRSKSSEAGIGGVEVLPVAVLVTVLVTIVVMSAWNVIDAKFAATAAAREGARSVVETFDPDAGRRAATRVWDAHGRSGELQISLNGSVQRCERVAMTVSTTVESIPLPVLSRWSATTVRSTHTEVVDAHRPGLAGTARC